jgi:hypothetical protein
MRDTAVLSRPASKETTWQEPIARRPSFRTQIAILAGLFVLTFAIGIGVTQLIPGAPAQRVPDAEYAAVVAQLFLRDHELGLAQERLAVIGTPIDVVRRASEAAQAGKLASPNDRAALDTLSAALVAPSATTTPSSAAAGTSGSNSDASTADKGSPTTTTTSADSEGRPSWIGPFVAFFLALALGFLVLARTAGISLAGLRPARGTRTSNLRAPVSSAARHSVLAKRDSETGRSASISISEVSLDDAPEHNADDDETRDQPIGRSIGRRPRATTLNARRPITFQSQYRMGDDPFEEIHPIADPRTGGLIAACGLTATLRLDSVRSGGYYAFTAWIQDYAVGDELHAAGLVAPGSTEVARGAINSWARSGQVDTVMALEPGTATVVGTDDLKATINVVDVSYGKDDRIADAYITGLTVRFDVQQHDQDDEADNA